METLVNYIDNLFRNYPGTPEVRKAREELLAIMEDKYHELKSQGKSENEAIGVVISEFGNMDEIDLELGEGRDASKENSGGHGEVYPMNIDQAKEFVSWKISFGYFIALGAALCILSPVAGCILDAFSSAEILSFRITSILGETAMFCMVAAGVAVFIIKRIADDARVEKMKGKKILLDNAGRDYMEREKNAYIPKFGAFIASGVGLCILSVVPVHVAEEMVYGTQLFWIENLSGALLFIMVACGVACFVMAKIRKEAYDAVLGLKVIRKQKKKNKVMEIVAPIYWMIITLFYFTFVLMGDAWGVIWFIWPLAALFYKIMSGVVIAVTEGDMQQKR